MIREVQPNMINDYNNKIIHGNPVEIVREMGTDTLDLLITTLKINNHTSKINLETYMNETKEIMQELFGKIVSGGRICIITNHVTRYIVPELLSLMESMGFHFGRKIRWINNFQSTPNTYELSPREEPHNLILVFKKGAQEYSKKGIDKNDLGLVITHSTDEFNEYYLPEWECTRPITTLDEFPIELVYRLIQCYSYLGDMVVDPFSTNANMAIAAIELGRRYMGIVETREEFKLIEQVINLWQDTQIEALGLLDGTNYYLTTYRNGDASCMFCSDLTKYILNNRQNRRKIAICEIHLKMIDRLDLQNS